MMMVALVVIILTIKGVAASLLGCQLKRSVAASLLGCQLKRSVLVRNFFGNLLLGLSKLLFGAQQLGSGW
jgi:hypothetical protein